MKVRIGFGLGTRTSLTDERFGVLVDALERLRFDSLWVSERIGSNAPDPLVAMSYAAGRTTHLKFGMSVMVLPGRNPIVLAKALASLASLSNARLLPAFGLGIAHPLEQQAFGVERHERAAWFDESLSVMRQAWTGAAIHHEGPRYRYDGVRVGPTPSRMDVWLGGIAPSELKRVGRLADGWLPSFVTPADAEAGRAIIESVCDDHGRSIDDDHYGVLIPYANSDIDPVVLAALAARRPDVDVREIIPTSFDRLADLIEEFVAVGTTKFVVVPLDEPESSEAWIDHVEAAAATLLPLER